MHKGGRPQDKNGRRNGEGIREEKELSPSGKKIRSWAQDITEEIRKAETFPSRKRTKNDKREQE
jgi:hypothetical protein